MSEFWQMFWWIIEVFILFAYLIVLFNIVSDLFRDRELGGFAKAVWLLLLLILPILTALAYILVRGTSMAERSMAAHSQAKEQADAYIREVAGTNPASEIATAKSLLDSGAITAEEFESLKARILG